MNFPFRLPTAVIISVLGLATFGAAPPSTSPSTSVSADMTKTFLDQLNQGQVDNALGSWDYTVVNDKLKARLEKMSAKVKGFGGITKVDIGQCEARRTAAFEKKSGEKIDVIPVEIICGDGNLLLAVFSVRQKDGEPRIFNLESLKEWGGTASLDEEIPYHH